MDTGWKVLSGTTVDSSSDVVMPIQTRKRCFEDSCQTDVSLAVSDCAGWPALCKMPCDHSKLFCTNEAAGMDDACHINCSEHYSYR